MHFDLNKKFFSKLSIGTANLNNNYGLLKKNKINLNQFKNLIRLLKKKNIRFIDTSSAYGNSESFIGELKLSKFKIITKSIFDSKTKSFKINETLKNLRQKPYAILFHKFQDYKKNKKKFLNEIKEAKVSKYGVSIYSKKEFNMALKDNQIKIIQIPGNFFNQKLLDIKLLEKAQKKKIEIEVRSVFMQGLLFDQFTKIVKILKLKDRKKIQSLEKFLKKNNINLATLSLFMIINNPLIKRVILGFNNKSQFLNIFKELRKIDELKIENIRKFYFVYNKNFNILNWIKK